MTGGKPKEDRPTTVPRRQSLSLLSSMILSLKILPDITGIVVLGREGRDTGGLKCLYRTDVGSVCTFPRRDHVAFRTTYPSILGARPCTEKRKNLSRGVGRCPNDRSLDSLKEARRERDPPLHLRILQSFVDILWGTHPLRLRSESRETDQDPRPWDEGRGLGGEGAGVLPRTNGSVT